MRRTDILLAVLVVLLVVGLIFGPPLLREWRDGDEQTVEVESEPEPAVSEGGAEDGDEVNAQLSEDAEIERVSGMLMLYKACANRIDGFEEKGRPTLEAWKQRHADTLAKRGAELDFHIVLADPEGVERTGDEQARAEERAMCERNLEAMHEDLETVAN